MEGSVFTTAAGGRRRGKGGGRDSPTLRSARSTPVGPRGWVVLRSPHPRFLAGGRAHLVYGEGYSSSALVIAFPIFLLHPCGMPA